MLLSEAFETAAEMPADSGDEAPVEEETANDDEASADDEMEATEGGEELPGDHPLDGMVLMLSISRDDLANAPSFSEGEFPNVDDESWHQTIVGFYDEILSETADTSSQESVEVNGDSDDEDAEATSDTESEDDSGDESEDDTESNGQN